MVDDVLRELPLPAPLFLVAHLEQPLARLEESLDHLVDREVGDVQPPGDVPEAHVVLRRVLDVRAAVVLVEEHVVPQLDHLLPLAEQGLLLLGPLRRPGPSRWPVGPELIELLLMLELPLLLLQLQVLLYLASLQHLPLIGLLRPYCQLQLLLLLLLLPPLLLLPAVSASQLLWHI